MERLISGTTAYGIFDGDLKSGRVSHAYLLDFADAKNLRPALMLFALRFFGFDKNPKEANRLLKGGFQDFIFYPEEGKKPAADGVAEVINETAMRPAEGDRRLFILSPFNEFSPLLQNKLLKTLEEPPQGAHFILGATSLSPVLDTVKSRVKILTIPPFSSASILQALERRGENPLNEMAALSCGGILGEAENMVEGGWFKDIADAAEEICSATDIGRAGELAIKYGDTKYKAELLKAVQQTYYLALCAKVKNTGGKIAGCWSIPALEYALQSVDKASADLKFNAFFQGLLFDLMLRIIEENDRWLKLRA